MIRPHRREQPRRRPITAFELAFSHSLDPLLPFAKWARRSEKQQEHCFFPCYEGMATVFLDQGDDERSECYFVKADEVCAQAGVSRFTGGIAVPVVTTCGKCWRTVRY